MHARPAPHAYAPPLQQRTLIAPRSAVVAVVLGEILALTDDDIIPAYGFSIRHSWDRRYGLKGTKTGHARPELPLPTKVLDAVGEFMGRGGYIFTIEAGGKPVDATTVTKYLGPVPFPAIWRIRRGRTSRKAPRREADYTE